MATFKDQLNRTIELAATPKRIVSLVPSQTELLHHLGLSDEVLGITKFCIHPNEWFRNKTRIGGTKQIDIEKIKSLHPDLIIANKEENDAEQLTQLMTEYPVWISDIKNLSDALQMIDKIGLMTDKSLAAKKLISEIETGFINLIPFDSTSSINVCYLIWYNPIMVAAIDTFIDAMLTSCGFKNALHNLKRYPRLTNAELKELNPDLLFLSSEPFPFNQKHADALQELLPGTKIYFVDGELFSWYGSRLLLSVDYFKFMIHQIKNDFNK